MGHEEFRMGHPQIIFLVKSTIKSFKCGFIVSVIVYNLFLFLILIVPLGSQEKLSKFIGSHIPTKMLRVTGIAIVRVYPENKYLKVKL